MNKRYQTTLNDKQESPHFEEIMDETLIISRVTREDPVYETELSLNYHTTMFVPLFSHVHPAHKQV